MGKLAIEVFHEAEKLGGLAAKAQLAAIARITSTEAATVADSADILSRLNGAMSDVKSQRAARPAQPVGGEGDIVPASTDPREAITLRRHVRSVAELMSQRALFLGDVVKTV